MSEDNEKRTADTKESAIARPREVRRFDWDGAIRASVLGMRAGDKLTLAECRTLARSIRRHLKRMLPVIAIDDENDLHEPPTAAKP